MSERNSPGLIVIGMLFDPPGQAIVEQGNDQDIEATKRQARAMVAGPNPRCFQAWVVDTVFEVTVDEHREHKA